MRYHDMVIEAGEVTIERVEKQRFGKFAVRVLESPAGEMRPEQATPVAYDERALKLAIQKLDKRELEAEELRQLGRDLAALLLPPTPEGAPTGVRQLFAESLRMIGPDEGLRLRLRLPVSLAAFPWEYMYVDRSGAAGMDGFLVLDPRTPITRHEALAVPSLVPPKPGALKIVAALASSPDFQPLDLSSEQADLEAAFKDQPNIEQEIISDATLDELLAAIPGAAVFHFAGHGTYTEDATAGTSSGTIELDDASVAAEQLGVNLRGAGVRLAVLGGCETGRRDGKSTWSGLAPALLRAEIPAVVANQFTVRDDCAIAFSKHFYTALVGGLPIEQAVASGRQAAYNAATDDRDWGVTVLYLRANDGMLFAGAADETARDQAAKAAQAVFKVNTGDVSAGGEVLGIRKAEVTKGNLVVDVTTDDVQGHVTGADSVNASGGSVDVSVKTEDVGEGGVVDGGEIRL